MSETLFLINPRRRKRRMPAGLRRYWASRGRGRKRNSRRRRKIYLRRRRNPRHHRRHRVHHRRRRNARHRRHHRARRRRNPFGGEVSNVLIPAGIGAAGAVVLAVAYGYLSPNLPDSVTSISGASAVIQGLGALGLGMLAGKFLGRQSGVYVAMGGLTVVLVNALTPYIASATGLPGVSGFGGLKLGGVGDYIPYRRPGGMGFINPAPRLGKYMYPNARLQGLRGMGAYVNNRNVAGRMGAYLANSVPGMRGFGDVSTGYTGLNVG